MKPVFLEVKVTYMASDAWRAQIRYPHCTFSQYCKSYQRALTIIEQWIEEERQEQKGVVAV